MDKRDVVVFFSGLIVILVVVLGSNWYKQHQIIIRESEMVTEKIEPKDMQLLDPCYQGNAPIGGGRNMGPKDMQLLDPCYQGNAPIGGGRNTP